MKEFLINIDNVFKIRSFASISSKYNFDINLYSNGYFVNAKSIIGIFTLDLTKPVKLIVYADDYEDYISQIKDFIVYENNKELII